MCDGAHGAACPSARPAPYPSAVGQHGSVGYDRIAAGVSDALKTGLVMGTAGGWVLVIVMELSQDGLGFKGPLIQPSAMGRDNFNYTWLLRVPSSLTLNAVRDGLSAPV